VLVGYDSYATCINNQSSVRSENNCKTSHADSFLRKEDSLNHSFTCLVGSAVWLIEEKCNGYFDEVQFPLDLSWDG